MTFEQAEKWKWNPFDLTKVWPHSDFPLIPVGQLVLNRNPKNYFQEVEQSAFCPAHMVPGIEASPDKMLLVRCLLLLEDCLICLNLFMYASELFRTAQRLLWSCDMYIADSIV
jgi:hypothetical protein